MPCVALTAGSLAFVALALLLIPSQLEGGHASGSLAAFDQRPAATRSMFNASLAQGAALAERASEDARAPNARRELASPAALPVVSQARGFSPVIDRPAQPEIPPPPPPPPAPVAEMAPPAPAPPPPPELITPPGIAPPAADSDAPHREP
jgi:hypothetical protein